MAMTPLPTPPSRNDPANFAERGDAFLAALPTFVTEANTLQEDVAEKQETASTAATTATQKAQDASNSATAASNSATAANQAKLDAEAARNTAQTHRNAAETAATDAQAAAAKLPSIVGKGLNYIRVKADETGNEYRTPAQVRSDIGLDSIIGTDGAVSFRNRLINGGAEVAQRAAVNLTTTAQYGPVDRCAIWASGGAVSAGTLQQGLGAAVGRTGKSARAQSASISGSGVISWRYRMEAADAAKLKNQTASFQIAVLHDVGSTINYTIIIRKANAADNFSAVTIINTGAPTAVASGAATVLKAEGVALGDCSNGLEIEIQAACGAVTLKNFDFTEWQLEEGSKVTAFERRANSVELAQCQRYYQAISGGIFYGWQNGSTNPAREIFFILPVMMRANPTASILTGNGSWTPSQATFSFITGFSNVGDSTTARYAAGYTASAEL